MNLYHSVNSKSKCSFLQGFRQLTSVCNWGKFSLELALDSSSAVHLPRGLCARALQGLQVLTDESGAGRGRVLSLWQSCKD